MPNENIRKLDVYQVSYMRLDEQQTIVFAVAVAPGQTEVQALEKADVLWAENAKKDNLVLFTWDDIQNREKRRQADPARTYWMNRNHLSGHIFF